MKAQTAMEYLMTYGWAIVIIVIVLAALAMLFSQSQTFEYCGFTPVNSFSCATSPLVTAPSGGGEVMLSLTIRNGYSVGVDVLEYACVATESGDVNSSLYTNLNKFLAPGDSTKIEDYCYASNSAKTRFNRKPGDPFSGRLLIKYRLETDDPSAERLAVATIKSQIAER